MYRPTHLYDELSSQIERNMHYCITAILYNKLFYHVKTISRYTISESNNIVATHHFHVAMDPGLLLDTGHLTL